MGFFDLFFGNSSNSNSCNSSSDQPQAQDWDRSVFDTDRFRNRGSGNWVDWEDVATGEVETDGFEHPYHDQNGEW